MPRLEGVAVGGGSDGNFTAALGIPTLDGLGAVGGGAHTDHEYIVVERMAERAKLVADLAGAIQQGALDNNTTARTWTGQTSAMALSAFRKGALLGAASILVIEGLVVVAVVVAWMSTVGDGPPEPTATRREAVGTVTQTGPRLCVEGHSDDTDEAVSRLWCGRAEPGRVPGVAVGDSVEGSIIEIELDPGSGPEWIMWESLTRRSE